MEKDLLNDLFNMHHKIKLKLDAICQEEGYDVVEDFMQVYGGLKRDRKVLKPKPTGIERNFQEDMINDMDSGEMW